MGYSEDDVGYEQNISRAFEVYEQIFTLKMGDSSIQQHFSSLRSLLEELDLYQPLTDITTMRRYREELAVAAYLSGLALQLSSQVWGHVHGSDSTPSLESTFARILRISIGTPTSTSDHSAMAVTRGCGRGRSFSRGGGRGWTDDRGRTPCEHTDLIVAGRSLGNPIGHRYL